MTGIQENAELLKWQSPLEKVVESAAISADAKRSIAPV